MWAVERAQRVLAPSTDARGDGVRNTCGTLCARVQTTPGEIDMTTSITAATAAPQADGRYDIYAGIHKALRLFMFDTLTRLGRLDVHDAAEVSATLGQLRSLLEICRGHLDHENRFVHTAIEAHQPGASVRIAREHLDHLEGIEALAAEATALLALPRAPAALRLYQHLARFIGENLEHMHIEESQHNAVLWAYCSDDEIAAVEQRLVASLDPADMTAMLRWMVPAMNPGERAKVLGGMQRQMPPEAMRAALGTVRPHLDDTAWAKLADALNLPPVPSLVTV